MAVVVMLAVAVALAVVAVVAVVVAVVTGVARVGAKGVARAVTLMGGSGSGISGGGSVCGWW